MDNTELMTIAKKIEEEYKFFRDYFTVVEYGRNIFNYNFGGLKVVLEVERDCISLIAYYIEGWHLTGVLVKLVIPKDGVNSLGKLDLLRAIFEMCKEM